MSKYPRWAVASLFLFAVVALLRPLLAGDAPLFCRIGGESFFPAFRTLFASQEQVRWPVPLDSINRENLWHGFNYEWVVFAPVPFRPGKSERFVDAQPPLFVQTVGSRRLRHWLGTAPGGRDVAAGMVAGTRVALLTGLVTMGMAALAGLLLGGIAGYFGDDRLRVSRARIWANLLGLPVAIFFAFVPRRFFLAHAEGWGEWAKSGFLFFGILLIFNGLAWLFKRLPPFGKKITLPADLLIMRLAEGFHAVPVLVLIVAVASLSTARTPGLMTMLAIIGLFIWPNVARMFRGELLRVRELEYVQAARAAGFSDARILLRHALPNAIGPVLVVLALGAASAILLEASLAFLGFTGGEPAASWGSLLHEARNNQSAWWLAVFPGAAICWTVLALSALVDRNRRGA